MDNVEDPNLHGLKIATIKAAFGGLPLEKRRKLVGELLESSRIYTPYRFEVPAVDPKFIKWIHSTQNKDLTEKDISHMFLIWTFARKNAYSAEITYNYWGDGQHGAILSPHDKRDLNPSPSFNIYHGNHEVSFLDKDEFFDRVFEDCLPEHTLLTDSTEHSGIYTFDEVHKGNAELIIKNLIERDGWDVKDK